MGTHIDTCTKNCYVSIYRTNYLHNVSIVSLNVGKGFFITRTDLETGAKEWYLLNIKKMFDDIEN